MPRLEMAEAVGSPEAANRSCHGSSRKDLLGLHTSGQEDVPRPKGGCLSAIKTVLTDVLGTIENTVVIQTECNRKLFHDAGSRYLAVSGVKNDGGTQSDNGSLLLLPEGRVALGLILQESNAIAGIQEARNSNEINPIGLGHACLDFFNSPTGIINTSLRGNSQSGERGSGNNAS